MSEEESESVEEQPLMDDEIESQDPTAMIAHWTERLAKLQFCAHVLSHFLALGAVGMVVWWIELLGGLSWKSGEAKKVFNYHPLLMVIAFAFMTVAALSFRHYTNMPRKLRKLTHAVSWTVGTLCGAIALVAVFQSHNDAQSGFIANLYSMHSWIGILIVAFYLAQWLVGLYAFVFGNPAWKGLAVAVHKYVGPLLYQGVAIAILLGIQEKEGFFGCGYKVTEIDRFPKLWSIPLACRVSHSLGLFVLIMAVSTTFALQDFVGRRPHHLREDRLL